MIGKVMHGAGFAGVLEYAMEKEGAEPIDGNMVGKNPDELAREFESVAELGSTKDPMWHAALSAAPGEHLTAEKWGEVARDYMRGMGFDPESHQWTLLRHTDTDHDHCHLIVNRVHPETLKTADIHRDADRSIRVCRDVERQHGLTVVDESYQSADRGRFHDLRTAIDRAALDARQAGGSREQFFAALKTHGVEYKANQASTGRISGISYRFASETRAKDWTKGSTLGRGKGLDGGYSIGDIDKKLSGEREIKIGGKREAQASHGAAISAGRELAGAATRDLGIQGLGQMVPTSAGDVARLAKNDIAKQTGLRELADIPTSAAGAARKIVSEAIKSVRQDEAEL